MFVREKMSDDADVRAISEGYLQILDRISYHTFERLSLQYLFYPSSFMLLKDPWFKGADIVQLFNTHNNYFSHTVLPLISRRRPIVWRFSDMWAITGHCAHALMCERWKTGCGLCPNLSVYPELRWDFTALLWRIKKSVYQRSALNVVTPSKWLADLARQSPLLDGFPVHRIPNGIDTAIFHPIDKQQAREQLGIDRSKHVILFSSHLIMNSLKGGALLEEALTRVGSQVNRDQLLLLVVGHGAADWQTREDFPVQRIGHVTNDQEMARVYSAADVFVLPSLAENFPNAVLESMACGTPAVTFDVGGCPELVRHMETGYLARYKDAIDLANGIETVLRDSELRRRMAGRALEIVRVEYALPLEARRFRGLYEDIVRSRTASQTNTGPDAMTEPHEQTKFRPPKSS